MKHTRKTQATNRLHTFNIASHCTILFVDLVNWFWNRTRELWTSVLNVGSDNSMNTQSTGSSTVQHFCQMTLTIHKLLVTS